MTIDEKTEALQNALVSFEFPEKYFIYHVNKGANVKFAIASRSDSGGLNTHSRFMTYDECNAYLKGCFDGMNGQFKN